MGKNIITSTGKSQPKGTVKTNPGKVAGVKSSPGKVSGVTRVDKGSGGDKSGSNNRGGNSGVAFFVKRKPRALLRTIAAPGAATFGPGAGTPFFGAGGWDFKL